MMVLRCVKYYHLDSFYLLLLRTFSWYTLFFFFKLYFHYVYIEILFPPCVGLNRIFVTCVYIL